MVLVRIDSKQEKDTRGTLKSEVDRWVTKDNLVILDSLNYIKGFRYELYCISRAQSSPHCVVSSLNYFTNLSVRDPKTKYKVWVDTPIEMCKQWKQEQSEKDTYPDQLFVFTYFFLYICLILLN